MRKTRMHTAEESGRYARIGLVLLLALALGALLPVAASAAVGDPILHNSLTTSSTKWTGTWGGWGVTGGKYGQFVCSTCHIRDASNIKRIRSTIATPDTSKGFLPGHNQPVVFTRLTGTPGVSPGVMGDDTLNRTTSDRICEICHTWDNTATYPTSTRGVGVHAYSAGGTSLTSGGTSNHQGSNADDCTDCHKHSTGFKSPACNSCHGSPPVVSTLGGPSGLANTPHTTGSTSAGSHQAHVYNYGMTNCNTCHTGYNMPALSSIPSLSNRGEITINFNAYTYTTGSYQGQTGVPYYSSVVGASYQGNGNMTCSTVYCHSNGARTGTTYALPRWGYIPSAACGTCHGANANTPPASSAHVQHSGTTSVAPYHFACSKCHPDVASRTSSTFATTITNTTQHVNGAYNIAFDSTNPGGQYAGERCSNLYCHSIGNPNVAPGQLASAYSGTIYSSVAWTAGNIACNACHGKTNSVGFPDYTSGGQGVVTSNSHSKHSNSVANGGSNIGCQQCHYTTTTNGTVIRTDIDPSNHVNSVVTVSFSAAASTPTATFVSASHTCQSTYCHGVNIVWGQPGPLACDSCHGASNALQGKHSTHYASATTATSLLATDWSTTAAYRHNCGVCHYNTNHAGGEQQANIQSAEVAFDPTVAGGGSYFAASTRAGLDTGNRSWTAGLPNYPCSNTYCHSQGTTVTAQGTYSLPVSTMSWTGSYTLGCNGCHGSTADTSGRPAYGNALGTSTTTSLKKNSHAAHQPWNTIRSCQVCHGLVTTGGTVISDKQRHGNKTYNVDPLSGTWTTFAYTFANDGGTCATAKCHANQTAKWGTIGFGTRSGTGSGSWDCVTCHSYSFKKTLGAGTIRKVVGTGGDFNMAAQISRTWTTTFLFNQLGASRHLFGASTILKWDCIVCHREGQAFGATAGGVNWGIHNETNGLINLRNVDTTNESIGWQIDNRTWTTNDYTNLDTFCLSCHDTNGASQVAVNATNNGISSARALTPFNTTDVKTWGGVNYLSGSADMTGAARDRVVDVKRQFDFGTPQTGPNYNGNPSQHGVIGRRYSTIDRNWGSVVGSRNAWSTWVLRKSGQSIRVLKETALLSCADCHILDAGGGAHGGTGAFMLRWATGNLDNNCWGCHSKDTYGAVTAANPSRVLHGDIDGGNPMTNASGARWGKHGTGNWCMNCHSGFDGTTTVTKRLSYGGIHGAWGTVNAGGLITKYRFFPGTFFKKGGGDASWTATTAISCYFNASTEAAPGSFTYCSRHGASNSSDINPVYNRPVKY